jgi:peroxiredoxin
MEEKHHLEFPVLSDVGSIVAKPYGIVFELPESLHEILRSFGADLPALNGKGDWVLPIPATYVTADDGRTSV